MNNLNDIKPNYGDWTVIAVVDPGGHSDFIFDRFSEEIEEEIETRGAQAYWWPGRDLQVVRLLSGVEALCKELDALPAQEEKLRQSIDDLREDIRELQA